MKSFLLLLSLMLLAFISTDGRRTNECASLCNDLRRDVLTREICRDAKKLLPRPKIGDFCDMGMEQAYSDACIAICTEEKVVSRIAQTCRAAAIEMPRPTVRKWCEHGYNVAFDKTKRDVGTYFKNEKAQQQRQEDIAAGRTSATSTTQQQQQQQQNEPKKEEPAAAKIIATVPISLEDAVVDLHVHDGETAEDAVIAFCKVHMKEDMSGCIRQLLPNVLDSMGSS